MTTRKAARSARTVVAALLLPAFSAAGIAAAGEGAADPADPVSGKSHWAFQALDRVPLPAVDNASWPRSSLDHFVLARLEREGLAPGPDAGRRDLLRRVYFVLTGLPPTPGDLASFLGDDAPDALPRLVDRLLASPRFGERWGRHWLDLARYADSNGFDENFLFREAWRYRDWVIAAVNAGMPFDRFVLEQLAGDLLPYGSVGQRDRQRTAAGFLVVGPKVLLGNTPERQRMEIADEQIDTVGRALLGQSLGCARCHDHKIDPFPARDYYALAGIFTSTRIIERRHMLGQQRNMVQLIGLGAEGEGLDTAYEKYWRAQPKLKKRAADAKAALKLLVAAGAAAATEEEDEEEEEEEEEEEDRAAAALAKGLENDAGAFADGAKDENTPLAERVAAQEKWLAELEAELADPPPIPPRAMVPSDAKQPADEHIRLSGEFDRRGEQVSRGFLRVLCDGEEEARPVIPPGSSGRVALARWLTDGEGRAGQLAARVLANRVWHHLFGHGIVRTVDNFGRAGEAPDHPELLDFLAGELIGSGWSIKALIRQVVLSRTFGLGSARVAGSPAIERDPDNRLLWRAHRRRLGPEAFRDAVLAAAGQLDLSEVGGTTVVYLDDQASAAGSNRNRRRTDFVCRSVYLPVIRNDLPEVFEAFDFADPHVTTGARNRTTVPTQALFVLNDEELMDAAEQVARRVMVEVEDGDPRARVERVFELVLGAPPTRNEREAVMVYLGGVEDGVKGGPLRGLARACHALFASSRFQYVE